MSRHVVTADWHCESICAECGRSREVDQWGNHSTKGFGTMPDCLSCHEWMFSVPWTPQSADNLPHSS